MGLLHADELAAFQVENPAGRSLFLLTADHAGRLIPRALGNMGLHETELSRHIAWDIGIAGVTRRLAKALDAVAVLQTYSRLVIDCNRQPALPNAFPAVSEATAISSNAALSDADKRARQMEIFDPYHAEITRLINERGTRKPIYIALHSFTPVYLDVKRPMLAAVLYNRNPRFSQALAGLLREEEDLIVAENEPYSVSDETDYGVPVHAEQNGLDYAEIEIRQDLITEESGQVLWAERLARLLPLAAREIQGE